MLEINLTNGSQSQTRNFVNLVNSECSIESHMELTLYKSTCDNRTLKKTVYIFEGYEYCFKFFDSESGCIRSITGMVESMTGDNSNPNGQYITVKCFDTSSSETTSDADVSVTRGLPNCGCFFNKPDAGKYNTPITVDIPISSISDVSYVRGTPEPGKPPRKKGVKVVLLGISADIVRAVVINLKMIDDGCDCSDAVRDVNLKAGNIYTIAYYSSRNKAMYEFDGKLISIKETDQLPSTDTVVRCPVCEQVGLGDSIYNSSNCTCITNDKDEYLTSEPMDKDILLTFDISEDFSGEYATIMLSWIRDCKPIAEYPDMDDGGNTGTIDPDIPNCECCCGKPIHMASGETSITIDPVTKDVTFTNDNISDKVSLQEVIDFYFGGC